MTAGERVQTLQSYCARLTDNLYRFTLLKHDNGSLAVIEVYAIQYGRGKHNGNLPCTILTATRPGTHSTNIVDQKRRRRSEKSLVELNRKWVAWWF